MPVCNRQLSPAPARGLGGSRYVVHLGCCGQSIPLGELRGP